MDNLSKIRREKMISFLETLKEQHSDDESLIAINQIEKELTNKRYGLVWEEHEEKIDVQLKHAIPVFKEERELSIEKEKDAACNFILEGDNLHSLNLLDKTLKNAISVIIIDPPYNRGLNDFQYDDDYVDRNDGFKHSKWLSFMGKRLQIARRLLKPNGVIFINIDENEFAQLKLLCDEIFGEANFISCFPWHNRTSIQNDTDISINHEFILAYAKNRRQENRRLKPSNEDMWFRMNDFVVQPMKTDKGKYANPDMDPRGLWKADPFDAPNVRPNLTYEIENPNTGKKFFPPKGRCWRTEEFKYWELLKDNRILFGKTGKTKPQLKVFYEETKSKGEIRNSWLDADQYSTSTNGKKELLSILPELSAGEVFETPKPVKLYMELLSMALNPYEANPIILDFFAGSGTLGEAVLRYGKENNRNVSFILCTNNQNNICRNITYRRMKKVITGYQTTKGKTVEGIAANLKYYVQDYVEAKENVLEKLCDTVVELIQLEQRKDISTDALCVISSDEEIDELEKNENAIKALKTIYLSADVLLTEKQEQLLSDKKIIYYPMCYYDAELREVGAIW